MTERMTDAMVAVTVTSTPISLTDRLNAYANLFATTPRHDVAALLREAAVALRAVEDARVAEPERSSGSPARGTEAANSSVVAPDGRAYGAPLRAVEAARGAWDAYWEREDLVVECETCKGSGVAFGDHCACGSGHVFIGTEDDAFRAAIEAALGAKPEEGQR